MKNLTFLIMVIATMLIINCAEDLPLGAIDLCEDNRSPIIYLIPDTSVSVNDTIWIHPESYDKDGDELSYSAECMSGNTWGDIRDGTIPHWGMDSTTVGMWFFAHDYDAPYRLFRIDATDPCGSVGGAFVRIYVIE